MTNNQPPQLRGKGGRPKRTFTNKDIALIEQYARLNCQNNTIALALDIPMNTLKRRFGKKVIHWRAQGKVDLRLDQRNLAKISSDMAKFLGKNVLGQVDKQVIASEPQQRDLNETEKVKAKEIIDFSLHQQGA